VDHGVETPQERSAAGKRDLATIEVRAYHSVDGVVIEVTDDGRGIDTDRVKTIAVERGIVDHARVSGLSEAEIVELLFLPGFSTAGSAGLLSGRGVGMDVVRTTVEAAGGSVTVESRRGSGTTVLLHLPSTLLGMPVLSFRAGGYNCMFSRSFVERVVDAEEFLSVAGKPVYRTGELLVPVLDLGTVLGSQGSRGPGVLCRVGTSLVVFRVSSVEGVIETLVRPIDILLRGEGIYSGMSLTDLGVPSLLLDPAGLLRRAGSGAAPARPAQEPAGEPTALAPGRKERGLVCSDGPALYVIPEAHVARVIRNPSLRSVHAHAGLFVLDGAPLKVRRPDGTETALPGILIHMEGRSCAVTVDEVHGFADLASTRSSGSTRLLETPEGVAIVLDPSDIFSSDVEWVRSLSSASSASATASARFVQKTCVKCCSPHPSRPSPRGPWSADSYRSGDVSSPCSTALRTCSRSAGATGSSSSNYLAAMWHCSWTGCRRSRRSTPRSVSSPRTWSRGPHACWTGCCSERQRSMFYERKLW
jgi:hypothetical protein